MRTQKNREGILIMNRRNIDFSSGKFRREKLKSDSEIAFVCGVILIGISFLMYKESVLYGLITTVIGALIVVVGVSLRKQAKAVVVEEKKPDLRVVPKEADDEDEADGEDDSDDDPESKADSGDADDDSESEDDDDADDDSDPSADSEEAAADEEESDVKDPERQ